MSRRALHTQQPHRGFSHHRLGAFSALIGEFYHRKTIVVLCFLHDQKLQQKICEDILCRKTLKKYNIYSPLLVLWTKNTVKNCLNGQLMLIYSGPAYKSTCLLRWLMYIVHARSRLHWKRKLQRSLNISTMFMEV